MINNLCFLYQDNKSCLKSNISLIDFFDYIETIENKILKDRIKNLYFNCVDVGLIYPTISIVDTQVTLKYDYENFYIKFYINPDYINFIYGILGKEPKRNFLKTDSIELNKQLDILNKFLYRNLLKIKVD
jgi:hypothetical protein